jgi:hypothetical protein
MKMPKAVKGIVESIQSTAINKQPLALQLPSSSILILIISIFSSRFPLNEEPKAVALWCFHWPGKSPVNVIGAATC